MSEYPWVDNYYLTNEEYGYLITSIVEDVYKWGDRPCHPEDVGINFEITTQVVQKTLSYLIDRDRQKRAKESK